MRVRAKRGGQTPETAAFYMLTFLRDHLKSRIEHDLNPPGKAPTQ
jgi:hypothetical protein